MLKVLYFFDIYLGSGFFYGYINLVMGLNMRLEDFIQSLWLCIDWAIVEFVDVVLFGGDVFFDVILFFYVQEVFVVEFCCLVDVDIFIVLLVGNYD